VGIDLDLDPSEDMIFARPGQVKSIALNLMVNALDAQPEGGRLKIRTALCRDPTDGGPAVSVSFQDEGLGVPAEVRERIFEPFFTTKQGGAGIGLAMAKQAVEENGGQIELCPRSPGVKGAEFVVIFPLAPLDAQVRNHPTLPHSESASTLSLRFVEQARDEGTPEALFTPGGLRTALRSSDESAEKEN
jgi:signal transduction histidine kinase